MLTKKILVAVTSLGLLTASSLAGCAADTTEPEEAVEESEEELTAAGKALIGSYKDDTGAFRGLILSSVPSGRANEFTADVDTGVRCVVAPCPSSERITGTFTAGTKTITLRSTTASNFSQHLLGKYKYLVQGNKFSLSRRDFAQSLEKVSSYCAQSSDCYGQDLIHPMCMGAFSCTEQSTCKWSCGVWPPPHACVGLNQSNCIASPGCSPKFGPSACSDSGTCTADMAYKGCERKACAGLNQGACQAHPGCEEIIGPSWCTPNGICSRDFAFKGCKDK